MLLTPYWFYTGLFLIYISVTFFGVLNVIAAVFIEAAMNSTAHHRELIIIEKRRKDEVYVEHIRSIFLKIDDDGSGQVSFLEIEHIFKDEAMCHLLESPQVSDPFVYPPRPSTLDGHEWICTSFLVLISRSVNNNINKR